MKVRGRLSIRTRLTLAFVAAVAVILTFAGVALMNLVHHSLESQTINQIDTQIAETQIRLSTKKMTPSDPAKLPTTNDIVIQVTNLAGTKVWATSTAIEDEPVLAHVRADLSRASGLVPQLVTTPENERTVDQLSYGEASTLTTASGPGLVFGFLYGQPIQHSERVFLWAVAISFPLLLLMTGGLVWLGIGLALGPVESIRRRVNKIAATDLTDRVPVPSGDDEIARLARTLNDMLARLEATSNFQHEFVSNASHELRSPLTTLLATTERAQGDPTRANWPEVSDVVMREGRRLGNIIDDLFWLARHEEGRLPLERVDVDLDDLLFEEATRVRQMTNFATDVSAVKPVRVVGDPPMLKRMVRNIVDNAMRYAVKQITFSSFVDGDEAVVRIANDGVGVDPATSDRLFERFARGDVARSREAGGTGLGLTIVRDIAVRHGGSARFLPVSRGALVELRVRLNGGAAPGPEATP